MNTAKLNKLWSKAVKTLFAGQCFRCRQAGTDAHHLIKRNTYGLKYKWHPLNGVWVCRSCHQEIENKRPAVYLWQATMFHRNWYCEAIQDKSYRDINEDDIVAELKACISGAKYDQIWKI